jgi:hypothetical protein
MALRMGFGLKARTLAARMRKALPGHAKPRINARAMRAIPRLAMSVCTPWGCSRLRAAVESGLTGVASLP